MGDCHVRFRERLGVKFPLPTRPLSFLDCSDNALESLIAVGLTDLETIMCYNNQLTSLVIGDLPALTSLFCFDNALTLLNLSGIPKLVYLYCSGNPIQILVTQDGTQLTIPSLGSVVLGTLDTDVPYFIDNYGYNMNTNIVTLSVDTTQNPGFQYWVIPENISLLNGGTETDTTISFVVSETATVYPFIWNSMTLNKNTLSLNTKKTATLSVVSAMPEQDVSMVDYVWSSSDTSVVEMTGKGGQIRAKSPGVAVITCEAFGVKTSCVVTVSDPANPVTAFSLHKDLLTMSSKKTVTLSLVDILPAGATNIEGAKWFTSNSAVVDFTGAKPGQIRSLKPGTAVITCQIGNVKAYCKVTVTS